MLSNIPIDLARVGKADLNKEILRAAIIAELDAVNLYEQLAAMTDDPHIRAVLLEVAKEEKTHVGEFQAMLLRLDEEQVEELQHGREEVEELTGKKFESVNCATAAGLVIAYLGRVPAPGEAFDLEGLRVQVMGADRKRVHWIRVQIPKIPDGEGQVKNQE